MQSLHSIEETSYLSAPNAVQYRTIMRIDSDKPSKLFAGLGSRGFFPLPI